MATVAIEPFVLSLDMAVTMVDIGWDGFETIARMREDRSGPRLIYAHGSLTLVSPSHEHEHGSDRLDRIVMAVCSELRIPCHPAASTLYRRQDLDHGIEGDKTYYVAHEGAVRGKKAIDLNVEPPPDLAIEVQITHPAEHAVETWRALGVPEVWVYDGRRHSLKILHLDEGGLYAEAQASRAFPFLVIGEILAWVEQPEDEPESWWEGRLREWVRDELARRLQGGV
jgi:Uma2 family endonuclease